MGQVFECGEGDVGGGSEVIGGGIEVGGDDVVRDIERRTRRRCEGKGTAASARTQETMEEAKLRKLRLVSRGGWSLEAA